MKCRSDLQEDVYVPISFYDDQETLLCVLRCSK